MQATVTTIDGKQVNVTVSPDGGNSNYGNPPSNPPPYQSYEQNSYPHPVPQPGPGYQQPMGYPPQQPNYPPPGFHSTHTIQPGTVIVTNPVVVQPGETRHYVDFFFQIICF